MGLSLVSKVSCLHPWAGSLLCFYFAKYTHVSKYVSESLDCARNFRTKEALANVISTKYSLS